MGSSGQASAAMAFCDAPRWKRSLHDHQRMSADRRNGQLDPVFFIFLFKKWKKPDKERQREPNRFINHNAIIKFMIEFNPKSITIQYTKSFILSMGLMFS